MQDVSPVVQTLLQKGFDASGRGDYGTARERFHAAVVEARRLKDYIGEANGLLQLSTIVAKLEPDLNKARKLLVDCANLCAKIKLDRVRAYALSDLGGIALDVGNLDEAGRYYSEAFLIGEKEHDKYGTAVALLGLGQIDKQEGHLAVAEKQLRQSLLIFEGLDDKRAVGRVLLALADISYTYRQDLEQAESLLNRAVLLFEQIGLADEANRARHNFAIVEQRISDE